MGFVTIVVWFAASLIFILGPIILIHELGHFWAAKRSGVRVEEFGIGYPPRMITLAGQEGSLVINDIPMVIPGRLRLPLGLARGQRVEALVKAEQPGPYRIQRLAFAPDHLPEDAFPSYEDTEKGRIYRGTLTSYEPSTQYTLNWIPFGGFTRMTGEEDPSDPRSLSAQSKRARLLVLAAGSLANLLAAFLLLTAGYVFGHPERFYVRVSEVIPGSAAEAAGILPEDVITEINGAPAESETPFDAQERLRSAISASAGQPLTLTILRDGTPLAIVAVPSRAEDGYGFLGIGMLDIEAPGGPTFYSIPRAAASALGDMGDVILSVAQLPRLLIQGDVAPQDVQPTSVVGINEIVTISLQESLRNNRPWYALNTAAMVSLALGLTNLLPLPALDGGRIVFVLIEAIRGRRIRPEVEASIHFAGMVILLALLAVVMVRDIVNPVLPWEILNQ
ncbi:MAG: site-2 protease family protein [Anaerolineae bacterium]|nr:site-2 protease family protein [Anaerolineae bacterium]